MKLKTIGIFAAMFVAYFFINDYFQNKREARILKGNSTAYQKEIKGIKNDIAEYQFDSDQDLKNYLNSSKEMFRGIESKLNDQDIKLRNIRTIVGTRIESRDTIVNVIELDSLYEKILSKENFTIPIEYNSGCFYIKAELRFFDGTSEFRSLEEKYNDTLTYVTSDYRKPHRWLFGFKTTLFSRKLYKVVLWNSCGETTTILIGGPANRKKQGLSQ